MFKNLIPWKRHDTDVMRGDLVSPLPRDIARFRDEFDSLIDRVWGGESSIWNDVELGNAGWGCEMEDSDKEIVVRAEAPGFELGEIDIQLSGDRLVLKAEHHEESKKDGSRYDSKFYRALSLPRGIETDKIKAEYKNGVLEVHLPKGPEAQTKRIPVAAK